MYNTLIAYLRCNSILFCENISASSLVSFKIGGNADIVVYPHEKCHITDIIKLLRNEKIRYTVLGNGTNTYFSDEGYRGVIISTKLFNKAFVSGEYLVAQCGASIMTCAELALMNGLAGLEFAYGIPGNVGGCVYMNASAFNRDMTDVVIKSTVYNSDTDEIYDISLKEHNYGMKHSVFMENRSLIVLETSFKLEYGVKDVIRINMESNMQKREKSQPLDLPSAGSVFKRPVNGFASKFIDEAGLKGTRIGDAFVSQLHAGFIVNIGCATASDVKKLIQLIKDKVYNLYGVLLEEEIIYIE